MTEANKILTVSYGTFSCTLEGFDDPFTTMKAIAEYFRDLAADDRYFGAEPPTPDAAMLHRIAEREVQRRVEAKISENGVTLRTGDAMSPMQAPAEPAPQPQTVTPTLDATSDTGAEESVAARLLRLRRATSDADIAPAATAVTAAVVWAADEASDLYEDEHFDVRPSYDEDVEPAFEALTVDLSPDFSDTEVSAEPIQTAAEVLAEAAATVAQDDVPAVEAVDVAELSPPSPAPEADVADVQPQMVNGALQDADDITNIFADTFEPVDVIDHVATSPAPEPTEVASPVMDEALADDIEALDFDAPVALDSDDDGDVADSDAEDVIEAAAEMAEAIEIAELAAEEDLVEVVVADDIEIADPAADEDVVEVAAVMLGEDTDALVAGSETDPNAVAGKTNESDLLQRLILGREDSPRVDQGADFTADAAEGSYLSDMIATMAQAPHQAEAVLLEAIYDDPVEPGADDLYFADILPEDEPPVSPDLVEELRSVEASDIYDLPEMIAEEVAEAADETMDEPDAPAFRDDLDDVADHSVAASAEDIAPAKADMSETRDDAPTMSDDEDLDPDDLGDDANAGLLSKAQLARARVIKVRRPGTTERPTMLGDAGPMPLRSAHAAMNLSDAAEAELAAELAAADGDPDALDGDKDADVARLMRQADTEMAGPESRRRLSAIAHLKAAVAATIADRRVSRGKATAPEEERIDPYRDDLARAVRPSQTSDIPAPGMTSDRPGPLVLVSEQRIDRPKVASTAPISAVASTPAPAPIPTPSAPVMPVRPRRIGAGSGAAAIAEPLVDAVAVIEPEVEDDDNFDDAAIFADPRSFSEFAERLGAEDLPSLLQAAAAYAMEVEDMPSFSRPQLLRQIEAHGEPGDFQREDVLRSFGQLLRTGDFIKKRRGQYALQDGALILADARKIAAQA